MSALTEVQNLNRTSVFVVHPALVKLRDDNAELDRLRVIAMRQINATLPRYAPPVPPRPRLPLA